MFEKTNTTISFISNLKKCELQIVLIRHLNTESRIDYSDYSMCVWTLEYDMSISCIHACLWKYINCKEFSFLLINC